MNQDKQSELLPCPTPWCDGGGGAPYVFTRRRDCLGVYCPSCSVATPYCRTEAEAIAIWNDRPSLSTPSNEAALSFDMTRALPGGKLDDCTYEAIEEALDRADAPSVGEGGKWLTLAERVASLSSTPSEGVIERALGEALEELVEAVEGLCNEPGGPGISGFLGARLTDARNALARLSPLPLVEENQ